MEEKLIKGEHPFISVTGGGGKTTFLVEFGNYLREKGMNVLLTTTTKLARPGAENYGEDYFFPTLPSVLPSRSENGSVTLFAHEDEWSGKLVYPGKEEIGELRKCYDAVLCEADGSRHLPVKVHTARDPVILSFSTALVSLVGLWCVGEMAANVAFGDERKCIVDRKYLQAFIDSEEGPLKGMRDDTENILLFNGGDDMSQREEKVISSLVIPSSVSAYIVSERKGVIYNAL